MDPDGNYTRYVFDNVNPHILSSIEYNAYNPPPISSNDPAPGERKTLSSPTATKVTIEYGTVIAGYGDGFLRNIRIVNQGSQGPVTVRRYALNYQLYTDWLTNVTVPKIASVTEFGGENGLSRSAVAFEYTRNLRLSAITGPFGARRALTWSVLSSGDRVSNVTTTGPGLATHSVSYSYGTLTAKATYSVLSYTDDEYRGYDQSWAPEFGRDHIPPGQTDRSPRG